MLIDKSSDPGVNGYRFFMINHCFLKEPIYKVLGLQACLRGLKAIGNSTGQNGGGDQVFTWELIVGLAFISGQFLVKWPTLLQILHLPVQAIVGVGVTVVVVAAGVVVLKVLPSLNFRLLSLDTCIGEQYLVRQKLLKLCQVDRLACSTHRLGYYIHQDKACQLEYLLANVTLFFQYICTRNADSFKNKHCYEDDDKWNDDDDEMDKAFGIWARACEVHLPKYRNVLDDYSPFSETFDFIFYLHKHGFRGEFSQK
ncbi:hypothetical protein Tco_0370277 [Tanacetum coccineum]